MLRCGAFGDAGCSWISSLAQAHFPTGLSSSTLLFAFLKGGNALGILLTSSPLVGAFFFNTLLRISNHQSSRSFWFRFRLRKASICSCALGDGCSRAISSFTETKLPTSLSSSALLLAFLKGGNALGVLLACGPLIGAFFLNTLLRISNYIWESMVFLDFKWGWKSNKHRWRDQDLLHWRIFNNLLKYCLGLLLNKKKYHQKISWNPSAVINVPKDGFE